MQNSALIVWFEGLDPDVLLNIPAINALEASGLHLKLLPTPLVEKESLFYQTLTGLEAGKIGKFDHVVFDKYRIYEDRRVPPGVDRWLLPDLLQSLGIPSLFLELHDWRDLYALTDATTACTLLRLPGAKFEQEPLLSLLEAWYTGMLPFQHLLLITDVWEPEPIALVNVNDFLLMRGLLTVEESRVWQKICWQKTLACGYGNGQIRINLTYRDPQGVVQPGNEYQELREVLKFELSSHLLDPRTGQPVIAQVLTREEAFQGPYAFQGPDLIFTLKPGYKVSPRFEQGEFDGCSVRPIVYEDRAGSKDPSFPMAHLLAAGPAFTNQVSESCSILDFIPLVLYMLGQPLPQQLDGDIPLTCFSTDFCHATPIRRFEYDPYPLSEEEESVIAGRLRSLGYLG